MARMTDQQPILDIRLLGPTEVLADGQCVHLRPFGKWLLAFLALTPGRAVMRERVLEAFWPSGPKRTRKQQSENYRPRVRELLDDLGAAKVCVERTDKLLLLKAEAVRLDLTDLERAVVASREGPVDLEALEKALLLHRGPFLEDCQEPWDWLDDARRHYQGLYIEALETLVAAVPDRDPRAERYLQLLDQVVPFVEETQHELLLVRSERGHTRKAREGFSAFVRRFRAQGEEPSRETTELFDYFQQQSLRESAKRAVGLRPMVPRWGRLPVAAAPVGRGEEVESIARRLLEHRLLSLVGIGGIGKTSVAVEVGCQSVMEYPDGVAFFDLADVSDPTSLLPRLASVFVDPVGRADLQAAWLNCLETKRLLLILDNCEHLHAECARVVKAVLQACPGVHILTTSRRALGLHFEKLHWVPPLDLPDRPADVSAADLEIYSGTQLFLAAVRRRRETFSPTAADARVITTICRLLEGIPFAIQLAAARSLSLSLEQIESELRGSLDRVGRDPARRRALLQDYFPGGPEAFDSWRSHHSRTGVPPPPHLRVTMGPDGPFGLLVDDEPQTPKRQGSMLAALEWSYQLLQAPERQLLHRLVGACLAWNEPDAFSWKDLHDVVSDYQWLDWSYPEIDPRCFSAQARGDEEFRYVTSPRMVSKEEILLRLERLIANSLLQTEEREHPRRDEHGRLRMQYRPHPLVFSFIAWKIQEKLLRMIESGRYDPKNENSPFQPMFTFIIDPDDYDPRIDGCPISE